MAGLGASQHGYPPRSHEPWTKLVHRERLPEWFAYNPKTMRPPPLSHDTKCMKILSWNINGLHDVVTTKGFSARDLAQRENFDVLCLQETHLEASLGVSAIRLLIYTVPLWCYVMGQCYSEQLSPIMMCLWSYIMNL